MIPAEAREKNTAGVLVLPEAALSIIVKQLRLGDNPYVFAGRGNGPYRGFSQAKAAFDRKLSGIAPWVVHDLRRSARSLMSRAGISATMRNGRVIRFYVEGVYDRQHRNEKADAPPAGANRDDTASRKATYGDPQGRTGHADRHRKNSSHRNLRS
jgi:hypothetical protein